MSEITTAQDTPERSRIYDNETVEAYADLADVAVAAQARRTTAIESLAPEQRTALAQGEGSVSEGVSFADIRGYMAAQHPETTEGENNRQAARLFNRMGLEINRLPEPEDVSLMDTTSDSALLPPLDVMAYSLQHVGGHMEGTDAGLKQAELVGDKLAAFGQASGGFDEQRTVEMQATLDDSMQRHANAFTQYPNLPEYL